MKNTEQIQELAAVHALGTLDGPDLRELAKILGSDVAAQGELSSFRDVAEQLARAVPAQVSPPPSLREKILRQAQQQKVRQRMESQMKRLVPAATDGFAFLRQASEGSWVPLRVPGASVKLLAMDEKSGHAIVLGKLEAGARYPEHDHENGEDLFMLSGDLHIGEHVIHTGDFHHADPGSHHGVNWSEGGCVLLAVLSTTDLLAQLGTGGRS